MSLSSLKLITRFGFSARSVEKSCSLLFVAKFAEKSEFDWWDNKLEDWSNNLEIKIYSSQFWIVIEPIAIISVV
jgi:hypothetical protein